MDDRTVRIAAELKRAAFELAEKMAKDDPANAELYRQRARNYEPVALAN